ncbi:MAG: glycosyltransferase family 9 protein [Pseudomonadota bacterium]
MAEQARAPRLLIVRRDNIGDLVCTTPLIAALRERLPEAWIGALVNSYNAEVLARNPALDEVFVYEKLKHRTRSLPRLAIERLRLLARLRRLRLDAVLVPAPSPQTKRLAARLGAGRLIEGRADAPFDLHEVERSFDLGRAFGVEGTPGPLRIYPDPTAIERARRAAGEGPFAAIHISARRPRQRWPLDRYAALARELAREQPVLLLWAPGPRDDPRHPGDDAAAREVTRLAASDRLVPLPTPDLAALIAALSLARLVVCPDGGAMHLAAALGKPVVALFGDSPPERWRPWGVAHRIVRPGSRDLADLPLAPVLAAARELSAEHSRR